MNMTTRTSRQEATKAESHQACSCSTGYRFLPSLKSRLGGNIDSELMHHSRPMYYLIFQIIFVIATLVLTQFLRKLLIPYKRGFFCGDTSILYPYKPSTYPYFEMFIVCNVVSFLIILIVEIAYYYKLHRKGIRSNHDLFWFSNYIIHPLFSRITQFSLLSLFGFALSTLIVTVLKYSFGQLRPNFINACQPNITDVGCNPGKYIEEYECTNNAPPDFLIDIHLSFPSGHTATAFYYAVFAIIYIQLRLSIFMPNLKMVFLLIQWLMLSLAAKIGVSRMTDNKHHPSDVIFGALFGSAVALSVLYAHLHLLKNDDGPTSTNSASPTKEVCASEYYDPSKTRKCADDPSA